MNTSTSNTRPAKYNTKYKWILVLVIQMNPNTSNIRPAKYKMNAAH